MTCMLGFTYFSQKMVTKLCLSPLILVDKKVTSLRAKLAMTTYANTDSTVFII